MRAEMAESEVERLRKDVEALVPEGVWVNGEKEDVLTMWGKVQAEKDAMAGEKKQMEMFKSRCKVLEKKNSKLGMELVREKEKVKKRRGGVEEALREEIRKLLNWGRGTSAGSNGAEIKGLKKQVVDLQTQLAIVKENRDDIDVEQELETGRAEVSKLRGEIEELKEKVRVQGGEEGAEEDEGDEEGDEEGDGEEGQYEDGEEGGGEVE